MRGLIFAKFFDKGLHGDFVFQLVYLLDRVKTAVQWWGCDGYIHIVIDYPLDKMDDHYWPVVLTRAN